MNNPLTQQNRRILVIDDNPAIHADFRKILCPDSGDHHILENLEAKVFGSTGPSRQPISFQLDSAMQGKEGYELVRRSIADGRPYSMVFMDVRMPPGWDGIETTARIWEIDPDLQTVICTAYADYSWDQMIAKLGISDRLLILKKPFDNVEVIQVAHALTEKWRLQQQARAQREELEKIVAIRTRELQKANEELRTEIAQHACTEAALRQSQKMEALGQLAGGIAHNFNNLLTIIRGNAQNLMLEDQQPPAVVEGLQQIDAAVERGARLASQMLMFGRKKRLEQQHLDICETLKHFGGMLRQLLGEDITLEMRCEAGPLAVYADPVMIEQVILNLAVNARDAMPHGGRLRIQADHEEIVATNARPNPKSRPGKFARISVADTGCGIAPEAMAHLFEPFFTTKGQAKGTGLGLATTYGIIEQHEGWIDIETNVGQGTTFIIFIPITPFQIQSHAAITPNAKMEGGNETILLVEDEPVVRKLVRKLVERQGYRVFEADCGESALAIWKEHAAAIDLLLTDMVMPGGWSGGELAAKLARDKAGLKIIYTTGYSLHTVGHDLKLEEGVNFLSKPYDPQKLVETLRRCLDGTLPLQPHSETSAGRDAYERNQPSAPQSS